MIDLKDNRYRRPPRPLSAESLLRRRDQALEEAAWEARLRSVAMTEAREGPMPAPAPSPVRTILDVVDGMTRYDNLVMPRTLPVAVGSDDEDLACGNCGQTIASHSSREALRQSHPQGDRLVIRCPCRALNVVCGVAGRRNRLYFRQRPRFARRSRV